MFRQLIPALLGLIVVVQTSSSFAGGSFFPHHHHHHHGHRHHHHHGHVFARPFPLVVHQPQFIVVRKWTPAGWVLVKQPVGRSF